MNYPSTLFALFYASDIEETNAYLLTFRGSLELSWHVFHGRSYFTDLPNPPGRRDELKPTQHHMVRTGANGQYTRRSSSISMDVLEPL